MDWEVLVSMKFISNEHKFAFCEKVRKNKGKLPEILKVLELLQKGMTQTQIAEIYGVTRQSVSKFLLKNK